jgi:hypothetical protein
VAESDPTRPSRRAVVTALGLMPLASLVPSLLDESRARAAAGHGYRFFSAHQGAVIKAAAARLVPGPHDDPTEKLLDSPGATEADVVRYIDTMLSVFDDHPPKIFAGGPWSTRSGGHKDFMKHFVPPAPRQIAAWKERVHDLRKSYIDAVKQLDAAVATKNFASATPDMQDQALTKLDDVRNLIFTNTIEGMYSVPEYGGNKDSVGWKSVSWPGDSQPRGYTARQVERSDGEDAVVVSGIVAKLLNALPNATQVMANRGWPRG